jgi:pilus assembly protein Flp/PilA
MKAILEKFRKFIRDEEGATAVEYAVMVALIIIVAIVAIQTLGNSVKNTFNTAATTIGNAGS